MLRSNNLAIFLGLLFVLFLESAQSPFFGFYAGPAAVVVIFFFLSPFIFRSFNAFLGGFFGWIVLCAWQWQILYFTIPYFIILSLIIYVFAKK